MRLICPNCNAQYEIDGSVIPETGRDVQCSACGHAWFQMPETAADPAAEAEAAGDSAEPARSGAPAPTPSSDAPATPAQRRQIDPSILEVLREEAEFEARARRGEAAPIETQADLGLSVPRPTRPVAPQRPAGNRPATAPAAPPAESIAADDAASAARPSRRDRLPDIDSVDPSLDQPPGPIDNPDVQEDPAAVPQTRRSGFRTGFLTAMVAFALVALVYVLAGRIVALAPGTEAAMTAFVGMVDQGRTWLNDAVRGLVGVLSPEPGTQG